MKRICNVALLISISVVLSSCSTYSRRQCNEMDWRKQGAESAFKGWPIERGEDYFTQACAGIPLDHEAFRIGYNEAAPLFCNPENIAKFSAAGGVYKETCPTNLTTTDFYKSYQTGREKFLERRVAALESQLSQTESALNSAESRANSLESQNSALQSTVASCQSF